MSVDSSANGLSQTPEDLGNADVVITTNETLRSDYNEAQASATSFRRSHSRPFLCRSPLLVVYWRGVFFDEAHRMDNATTGIAKAANSLRALVWLPMTGTPLQNEYSDLRSMAQLLDIKPLCYPQFFSQVYPTNLRLWSNLIMWFSILCCHPRTNYMRASSYLDNSTLYFF
jgi:SNF2 family DNA or RNA helicase